MITLLEIFGSIKEMSIAREGDWKDEAKTLGHMSSFIINHKYVHLADFKTPGFELSLYKMHDVDIYKAGVFITNDDNESKFAVVMECELSDEIIKNSRITNLKRVNNIQVINAYQGKGIAKHFYKFLVKKLKYSLLGDLEQYFGARRLWAALSRDIDVIVDIIDIKTGQYLDKNVTLHHGSYDADFDERVWSYNNDKTNIRLILKDMH